MANSREYPSRPLFHGSATKDFQGAWLLPDTSTALMRGCSRPRGIISLPGISHWRISGSLPAELILMQIIRQQASQMDAGGPHSDSAKSPWAYTGLRLSLNKGPSLEAGKSTFSG